MAEHCKGVTYVGNWPHVCHKPVKAEGYCAAHLAGDRRRKANASQHKAEMNARDAARDQQAHDVLRFATDFGIVVRSSDVPGEFIITREELTRLLDARRVI